MLGKTDGRRGRGQEGEQEEMLRKTDGRKRGEGRRELGKNGGEQWGMLSPNHSNSHTEDAPKDDGRKEGLGEKWRRRQEGGRKDGGGEKGKEGT